MLEMFSSILKKIDGGDISMAFAIFKKILRRLKAPAITAPVRLPLGKWCSLEIAKINPQEVRQSKTNFQLRIWPIEIHSVFASFFASRMFEKCENEIELERQVTRLHIDFWCNVELCFMITATQNNYTVCNTYMNIFPHKTNNCNWQKTDLYSQRTVQLIEKGRIMRLFTVGWSTIGSQCDIRRPKSKDTIQICAFQLCLLYECEVNIVSRTELNSRIFSCFFAECLIWNWRRNMFQNVTDTKQATMISWEIPTMYKSWHSLQICVTFGEMLNMAITREFGTLAGSGLW